MSDLDDPDVRRDRQAIFGETIKTILSCTLYIPLESEHKDLVQLVEDMWILVVQSKAYSYNSLAYDPCYHCLVVLFFARDGLSIPMNSPDTDAPGEVTLIEFSQLLHDHMPRRNCCGPYESKILTAAERNFLSFTDNVPASAMRKYWATCKDRQSRSSVDDPTSNPP